MTQRVKDFETWYEATVDRALPPLQLHGDVNTEVCVIGGGLAGITAAHQLSRRGKSVVLLECRRLAWGASGRNGGFVSNGFALSASDISNRVGADSAKTLYGLSRQGTEFVRQQIAMLDPSIKMGEGLIVALRHDDPASVARWVRVMRQNFDHPVEMMTTEETRLVLRSERYFQSVRDPSAFHIHPLRYALALASEAEAGGTRIFETTRATSIEPSGAGMAVKTVHGTVKARHVITCVSALDRHLDSRIGRAVLPVATYVAVTAPVVQDAILTSSAVADTRRAGDYYRLVGEGRLLWGGRITTRVSEPASLAEQMKRDIVSVYPQLGHSHIDYAWGGVMGYALHKMPLIGRTGNGRWYATAFGGHGLNTTAMAGILLARAIAEGDDEYRRFAAFAPRWAGGPFGRLGVQGSYWLMQLRDHLDEAKSRRRSMKEKKA